MAGKIQIKTTEAGVEITVTSADGVVAPVLVPPDKVLGLVKGLGKAHLALHASSPVPTLEGLDVEPIFNTRWYIQPELIGEASMFSFYHPFFGPVAFSVPIDQVPQMIEILTNHVRAAKEDRETPN